MFGLSWTQIGIIVVIGVFLLGPERIPTAVTWVTSSLRKVRGMAVGAQAELRKEIGPEMDELRRQIAELQSLKEIQELRDLRDLHPKRIIGRNLLGDEFSGGVGGFLGLNKPADEQSAEDGVGRTTGQNGTVKPVSATPSAAPAAAASVPMTKAATNPAPTTTAPTTSATASTATASTATDAPPAGTAPPAGAGAPPPFDLDGT